jgi:broad specificity phosphatase PhoE
MHRVHRRLEELPAAYGGSTVAAVTHAGFIVQTFLTLFAIPRPGTGARMDPGYTSVTAWEFDEPGRVWRLVTFNDTGHLAGCRGVRRP